MQSRISSRLSAARVALSYVAVALLWIGVSDLIGTSLKLSPILLTIKGFAFVLVTALLLYFTIKRLVDVVQLRSRERDEAAQLYRTVVEATEEGVCLLDELGRINFLNNRLAIMLDRPIGTLRGCYLQDFIPEPELLIKTEQRTTTTHTREFRLQSKSQGKISVLATFTPLLGIDTKFCGSLVMLLEITERKRLETELRQSQKMEALGSFAGGITHDFNNLLAIISGYSSLLEKSLPRGSDEGRAAREILGACHRGSLLVRQLLAFSRKQAIVPEIVDVCEVLDSFGDVLPRMVGERIAVNIRCDCATSPVRIGPGQIEQILMNLAANARDAMPHGGSLSITTTTKVVGSITAQIQGVDPGDYVALQVTDTGTGISPEVKSHIFEPFFTTKPKDSGTGLGLSTVYGIVAQHGGFLTCDSTVGVGTTFTVYLPYARSQEKAIGFPASIAREVVSGAETVLLVEDEPVLRELTKQILSSQGYSVLDASSGHDAIQLARADCKKIDLVLTDIVMPGMSGVELAREILRASPETKIAFMSGYTDVPAEFGGNVTIIQKPVTPDALLLEVRTLLDGRRATA